MPVIELSSDVARDEVTRGRELGPGLFVVIWLSGAPSRLPAYHAVCILACLVKILGPGMSFNLIQIHQPIVLVTISFDLLALSLQKLGDGSADAYIQCGLLQFQIPQKPRGFPSATQPSIVQVVAQRRLALKFLFP